MKIEDIENFDLHINGRQAGEIFNLINKIGIKEELRNMLFGSEKVKELQIKSTLKNKELGEEVEKIILEHMDTKEFKTLKKDDQTRFLNKYATEKILKIQQEERELKLELKNCSSDSSFDLIALIIERYYANQDIFYKTLASLYDITEDEVSEQSFTILVAMIKKITTCDDIKGIMKVFN